MSCWNSLSESVGAALELELDVVELERAVEKVVGVHVALVGLDVGVFAVVGSVDVRELEGVAASVD